MKKIKQRPAESASIVAGAVAALVGPLVGLDTPEEVASLAIVLGAIPAAVTAIVNRFGLGR
jgi:hypothetical protein